MHYQTVNSRAERLATLDAKVRQLEFIETRAKYEESLSAFVEGAWKYFDSSEFKSCFAIDAMCDHLEAVTLGHISRLLINIPPRASKTSVCSIIYPAWVWARTDVSFLSGPQVRFLCASYNHALALDSSNKSRRLLFSPWYQERWGHKVTLHADQNMKWNFANTMGGSRVATSVGGSLLGLGGDVLICLPYDEQVLTDQGWLKIGEIVTRRMGVRIAGTGDNEQISWQRIEKYETNPGGEIVKIEWDNGSLRCTSDHPVYVEGRGYIRADQIKPGDEVISCLVLPRMRQIVSNHEGQETVLREAWRNARENGAPALARKVVRTVEIVGREQVTYNLRVGPCHNYFAEGILVHNCDDLNKVGADKVVEMETDAERLSVEQFWNEFHSTRLNDPKQSAVIVVQQRVHENDVSGLILESDEDWVHLMIPMRYDSGRHCVTVRLPQYADEEPWDDPRKRDGELMWPERFGEKEVSNLENILGPYLASGRLQQSPSPKGGGIIKREWWQTWGPEEAMRYGLEWNRERKEFPHFELVVGSLDTSYGEKQENDFNALTIWGIWIDRNGNRRAMLMFAWAKRLPLHGKEVEAIPGEAKVNFKQRQQEAWGLVELVADTCRRYKVQRLLIEDKTRGRDVAQEINRLYARENWGVQLINPTKDKVSRTHGVVPLFTDGCVWAPDTKWADMVISQCASFPKASHDDLHDTCVMLLAWAREGGLLVRADEMSAYLEDEAQYKPKVDSVAQSYGV